MNYPKSDKDALESLKLSQFIIDCLKQYKNEMIYNPPISGRVNHLHNAKKMFDKLEELLGEIDVTTGLGEEKADQPAVLAE